LVESERAYREALEIAQTLGELPLEREVLNSMGVTLEYQGELADAEKVYSEAIRIAANPTNAAGARTNLAELYLSEGRPTESEAILRTAIKTFQEASWNDDAIWASAVLARALLAEGKIDEAARQIESTKTEGLSDRETRFEVILASAAVKAASHNPEALREARDSMRAMLAEAKSASDKSYEFEARLSLGEIETESDHIDVGRRILAELQKEARRKGYELIASKAAKAAKS
jgi:tetratricopeptide (TPR) repeat protein